MPLDIAICPKCQKKLRVPEDLHDQPVKCPTCFEVFTPRRETGVMPSEPGRAQDREVPAPRRQSDRDEERPRRRDEDEERPRRRWEDDEEDAYDRPRRYRRRDWIPHRGGVILAFGVVALVMIPWIFGPIAWIMGNSDLQQMRAGTMDPEGESITNAGRICGMIATILAYTCCFGYLGVFALMGSASLLK